MTRRIIMALVLVVALSGVALAWEYPYTTTVGVLPVVYDDWSPAGGAAAECAQIGTYQYAYKIEPWDQYVNTDWLAVFPDGHSNTITIANSDGIFFDWSATNSIGAVIVKGGTKANVFLYDPQAFADTDLYAPINPKNGKNFAVSHVTFCWNPDEECWQWVGETAWAAGNRYEGRGNWATYTPYVADSTVTLYAGQTMEAGTVHFSAVTDGEVTITITLNPGWRLKPLDEDGNAYLEPVKIQGYDTAPSGNPNPGGFDTYKGQDTTVTVPAYTYYGVHVDVEHQVPCQ